MNKLQAAMRDAVAKGWGERKLYYRVGSFFKGCHNCGEFHLEEVGSGRKVKRYDSGFQVFRSYCPKNMGWTYWCYECGAKDKVCWEDPQDLGMDAIRGSHDAMRAVRSAMRKQRDARIKEAVARYQVCEDCSSKIMEL